MLMKKFLLSILSVLVATTSFAASRTTLWEGEQTFDSSWPSVQISTSDLSGLQAGDEFVVTVGKADDSINPEWQWGPQVFINADWASVCSAQSISNGEANIEVIFTVDADQVAKILAASEIEVQGMNAVVTKVELQSGSGSGATEALPLDTDDALGSGWNSSYSAATKTITYESEWAGRGWWLGGVDWSAYKYVVVEIEPVDFYCQLNIEYGPDGDNKTGSYTEGCDAGTSVIKLALDEALKSQVLQVYLQSSSAGTITIKNAYLTDGSEQPQWEETGKSIAFDEEGIIKASEFNGYTDDAKVEFVFQCSDPANYSGWGAASVSSIDAETVTPLPAGKFAIKGETTTVTTTLGELKEALNTRSAWGTYGLYWNIWGFNDGACVNTRVSCTIYELVGATGDKFEAIPDEAQVLYVIGDVEGSSWDPSNGSVSLAYNADLDQYVGVITVNDSWEGNGWFAFSPILGSDASDWTTFNQYRYTVAGDWGELNTEGTLVQGVDQSFKLAAGVYTLYVSITNMTVRIEAGDTSVRGMSTTATPVEFYTTSGAKVSAAQKGINIVKYNDNTVRKVYVK